MIPVDLIKSMAHSQVHDYAIPGLTSSLIGGAGRGIVRLFSQSREHEEPIVPHSHRFHFTCVVLCGTVRNRVWMPSGNGDNYQYSFLNHHGAFGGQTRDTKDSNIGKWSYEESIYTPGETYSMHKDEVHSIYFSRGAEVLFFEGPTQCDHSAILEPVSNGKVIPTFKIEPWMFWKGG